MSEHKEDIIDPQDVDYENKVTVVNYNNDDDNFSTDDEEFQDSYESFVISTKDIESLVPTMPGTNNVHQIKTQQIKDKVASMKQTILMKQDMLKIYNGLANKDPAWKDSYVALDKKIAELKLEHDNETKKLENVAKLKDEFKEKLPLPAFGTEDTYSIEEARLAIPLLGSNEGSTKLFSTNNPGGVTLEEFWNKLLLFVEAGNLNEAATKKLLGTLLFGEPYKAYMDNKDKSIKDILQILIDRFGSIHTIADKVKALDNLKRRDGEKIQSVMNRCAILIDATKHMVPENEREMRQKLLLTQNLLKLVKPKARSALMAHRASAARAGYNMGYKELLNIAIDAERLVSSEDDISYSAFPAIVNKKYRSHTDKPYKHTTINKTDDTKHKFSPKPSQSISNPTTPGYKAIDRGDHIYQQNYQPSRDRQVRFQEPNHDNYGSEQRNYKYGRSNNYQNRQSDKQTTFVQRLDKNQLYQSIPMPFGCPQCGYGSEQTYDNYQQQKYNKYQKN